MAVTKVQMFKTNDGELFEYECEAIRHDNTVYATEDIKANLKEYLIEQENDNIESADIEFLTEYMIQHAAFLVKNLTPLIPKSLKKK